MQRPPNPRRLAIARVYESDTALAASIILALQLLGMLALLQFIHGLS